MNTNKVNLIFFLPNFSEGGAGRSIMKVCNNLDLKNYNIVILSIGKCYYKNDFKKKIIFYELNQNKTFFSFFQILKILNKNYPKNNSIFISNLNYTNVLSCFFLKFITNYKLILLERTPLKELKVYYNYNDKIKKKIIFFLMKIFYKYADKVVVNSLFSKREFKKKIKCNIELIHSPSLDKIKFKKFNDIKNSLKILTIGRLSREKRFKFLIESIDLLKKYEIQLFIIGNGSLKEKLRNFIKQKKLSKKIKLINFNKNYQKYFKKCNLYVNTSDFEGFPNTVVEAINNNLMVLSRDSEGGIHDIIIDKTLGKILKTNKPNIFANEIKKYFYKKNNIYTAKVKRTINKNFSHFLSKNVSKKYDNLFANLV
jgi:glycosyltransferase involved in cell wall biosynthesis